VTLFQALANWTNFEQFASCGAACSDFLCNDCATAKARKNAFPSLEGFDIAI
jgi:hypothetical protein